MAYGNQYQILKNSEVNPPIPLPALFLRKLPFGTNGGPLRKPSFSTNGGPLPTFPRGGSGPRCWGALRIGGGGGVHEGNVVALQLSLKAFGTTPGSY